MEERTQLCSKAMITNMLILQNQVWKTQDWLNTVKLEKSIIKN